MQVLLQLCKSPFKESALMQLSKMMDNDNHIIKINILHGLKTICSENIEIAKLIEQKGIADNHYLVRKVAEEYTVN